MIAGLLADNVFAPAMHPGGMLTPFFGRLFGTGKGTGIVLCVICALCMSLLGLCGYQFHSLRNVEDLLLDQDAG